MMVLKNPSAQDYKVSRVNLKIWREEIKIWRELQPRSARSQSSSNVSLDAPSIINHNHSMTRASSYIYCTLV